MWKRRAPRETKSYIGRCFPALCLFLDESAIKTNQAVETVTGSVIPKKKNLLDRVNRSYEMSHIVQPF